VLHPGPGVPWFVVLPDTEAAGPVAAAGASVLVAHPSGRPFVVGGAVAGRVTVGHARDAVLALIGQHSVTAVELTAAAGQVRGIADLDRLAGSLAGSSFLLASVAGRVRVQGTVTGVRRVFTASPGGVPVAASRADVLARLLGTGVDERRLALHLLHPHLLHPLAGLPVWHGVDALPGDSFLELTAAGGRTVRWWTPPEPTVPLATGAEILRAALADAVRLRTAGQALVSCDLGGLDSTAICGLAAGDHATVAAYTAASPDPLADDVAWATRTAAGLPRVEHHVVPAGDMPLVFAGLDEASRGFGGTLDEPCSAAVDRERWLVIGRRAAARGSRVHLTGFGGDELLYGSVAHLHDEFRGSRRAAVRRLRGFAAKYRWPWPSVLRQLLDSRSYRSWLAEVPATLTAPRPPATEPLLEWGFRPRLPPWATGDAVEAVRDQIATAAAGAEPLSPRRGQHRELETMRYLARMTRQFEQLAGELGLAFAAPYYDDRVVEAGLAVRSADRVTPWRYKPLIVEAMRGIVPAAALTRETKANGSGDEEPGLRRHRADVLALWDDSRLGALGLLDAGAVRAACAGPLPPDLQFGVLDQVVAGEVWLRSLERDRAAVTTPPP
jgi:asparagine synthase (glutamine-hydrolysing)